MHYEIRYQDGPAEDMRAINDAIEYLGREVWVKTFAAFIQPGASMAETPYSEKKTVIQQVRFFCMMCGISGRPVSAIIRGIWRAHP
jgi:hypothetical protein